ncbi:unnamed protein product [Haemonchus placei]|uniref:Uncharacterized protein n=1 Tax=Haemonchus placei TaxID=6290 RepID=A0A0N4WL25_HAEPC|nr:unnamed protein product [Haemonchus placei]
MGEENVASAGNRTRAARVAGEHSTTEPPMLEIRIIFIQYDSPSMLATKKTESSVAIEEENIASAGNRTRAARVAGEHSTTEPPMLAKEPEGFVYVDRATQPLNIADGKGSQLIRSLICSCLI